MNPNMKIKINLRMEKPPNGKIFLYLTMWFWGNAKTVSLSNADKSHPFGMVCFV